MLKHIHLANLLQTARRPEGKKYLDQLISGECTTLETFWKHKALEEALDANPDLRIFMDSGAYSLFNALAGRIKDNTAMEVDERQDSYTPEEFYKQLSVNERVFFTDKSEHSSDLSFVQSIDVDNNPDIQKYLDEYIAFIHKYEKQLTGYVNLDIIYNAEKSWEIQQYMEKGGVRPIPVFHHGEDFKWLYKYAEEYDYIGIGGVASGMARTEFEGFCDQCFKIIEKVKPTLKVHGFAITAVKYMLKWPWYSCDSTSWLKLTAFGKVWVPRAAADGEGFDYMRPPFIIGCSDIFLVRPNCTFDHYARRFSKDEVKIIHDWFDFCGVKPKTMMIENEEMPYLDTEQRMQVNVEYYKKVLKEITESGHITPRIQKPLF